MPSFSFRQKRTDLSACTRLLKLSSYKPVLNLEGLQTGIDNVRSDVWLSQKFIEIAGAHLSRLIMRSSGVQETKRFAASSETNGDASAFVTALTELEVAALNRAKALSSPQVDLLAKLAIVKFLRAEISAQYTAVFERLRAKLKTYEGPLQQNAAATIELRERVAKFQLNKKTVLRNIGQEIYQTLLDVEKSTLSRMRSSLFGEVEEVSYELLHNRLLFSEDVQDDHLKAEHYVMVGNYERDPDRLAPVMQLTHAFLGNMGLGDAGENGEISFAGLLNAPDNADELFAGGTPDTATEKGKAQQQLLDEWTSLLEKEGVLNYAVAAYEVPPLLREYCPPINPQQLKHALVSREERKRVCMLLEQHGKLSEDSLYNAALRVAGCKGSDRAKVAARFLRDAMRYHRDRVRFEMVESALDGINLITTEKLRELSAINRSLYEFLLPSEQKPSEAQVINHIVMKADVRDSSVLTRTLFERGLNPASYFSLNFYQPINKLLEKYNATKLFIEGDAVILALFEREGEPPFGVSRTCVLAREMIEIVRGYNVKSQEAGLPILELGIGICYQDSPPMYLMDGEAQIMISPALNESDRLSSCSRSARKMLAGVESLFNVFCFQTIDDADTIGQPEEFLMRFNIGGINLQQAAFRKLSQEISLQVHDVPVPTLWGEGVRLYSGVVPVGSGSFHKLVIRESRIPHVDARDFHLKNWTERSYYEVCTNNAIYEYLESGALSAIE